MIIITSDPDKLPEPGFKDFTIYDDGKVGVSIMGPEDAYHYVRGERDPNYAYWYIYHRAGGRKLKNALNKVLSSGRAIKKNYYDHYYE